MLVRKAGRLDIECVVRATWPAAAGRTTSIRAPSAGLPCPAHVEAQRLPEPIFTPPPRTTSAMTRTSRSRSGAPRGAGSSRGPAAQPGALQEPGRLRGGAGPDPGRHQVRVRLIDGRLALIDEVASPDSSRFWDGSSTSPAPAPNRSTSSSCGTGSPLRAGTENPRARAAAGRREPHLRRYEEAARRLIDEDHPLRFRERGWSWE